MLKKKVITFAFPFPTQPVPSHSNGFVPSSPAWLKASRKKKRRTVTVRDR